MGFGFCFCWFCFALFKKLKQKKPWWLKELLRAQQQDLLKRLDAQDEVLRRECPNEEGLGFLLGPLTNRAPPQKDNIYSPAGYS